MTGDQALQAARRRDRVRVDAVFESLPGTLHPFAGKTGKISELLGPRWYGRGVERAILEIEDAPQQTLAVIPLSKLEVIR